jgi:hypothetical protein
MRRVMRREPPRESIEAQARLVDRGGTANQVATTAAAKAEYAAVNAQAGKS